MSKILSLVVLVVSFVHLATASSPAINPGGVVNAASYTTAGMPNSGIARGSMFIAFGTGLGKPGLHAAGAYPLPLELEGTSVRVTANGRVTGAIMIYSS